MFSVNDNETPAVDSPHFQDIPNGYIEAGDLGYAYAMTFRTAQGLTCDRAHVLGGAEL